jgi:hypothetical protein
MIIISGSGRSGTTFLAKLFDTHPRVLYRHEPDSALDHRGLPFLFTTEPSDELVARAGQYLEELAGVRNPRTAVLPLFPKAYRDPVGQRLYAAAVVSSKLISRLGGPRVDVRLRIPDLIDGRRRPEVTTVIKTVRSLGRVPLFLNADPAARVVHILRHPCGVVASLLRGARLKLMNSTVYIDALFSDPFTRNFGFTCEQMESATIEEKLAFGWMVGNDKLLRETEGHPRCMVVVHRDLCTDTEGQLRRLFTFAGLDWGGEATRFLSELARAPRRGARYFSIIRPPLGAVDSWKEELTPDQVERIRAVVAKSAAARFFPGLTGPEITPYALTSDGMDRGESPDGPDISRYGAGGD